ncbi:unnamed protein product, partial [Brachionus calyciflorus]
MTIVSVDAKNDDLKAESLNLERMIFSDLLPVGNFEATEEFFEKILEIILSFIKTSNTRTEKIIDFYFPHDLEKIFDFKVSEEPKNLAQILNDCSKIMKHSVKTAHPRFFNQLSIGLDLVSLIGEFIAATTNTNMFTYEIAPVYNLMEQSVLSQLRDIVGWKECGDGILNPGGSISNLNAIQLALHSRFPNIKTEGVFSCKKPVIFTSKHSHYSIAKAASILGIGSNQVRFVPVDSRGKIQINTLIDMIKEAIDSNEVPILVNATAGTTVLGSFDPINSIADICQKFNIWLHID